MYVLSYSYTLRIYLKERTLLVWFAWDIFWLVVICVIISEIKDMSWCIAITDAFLTVWLKSAAIRLVVTQSVVIFVVQTAAYGNIISVMNLKTLNILSVKCCFFIFMKIKSLKNNNNKVAKRKILTHGLIYTNK